MKVKFTVTTSSRVLALDPASSTGVCLDGRLALWDLENQRPGRHKGKRQRALFELLTETVRGKSIDLIAFEKASTGAGAQRSTGLFHATLEGVILLVAATSGTPVLEVHPMTLKKFATGSGKATKDQMISAALAEGAPVGNYSDLADAYWVWRFGINHLEKGESKCLTPR